MAIATDVGMLYTSPLHGVQGLFFYHTKKVGFVAGVKWGSGIFVQHILDERGRESWSAPVLYKIHEVSLGLLAGGQHSHSCSLKLIDHRLALPIALRDTLQRGCVINQLSSTLYPCCTRIGNMQSVLTVLQEQGICRRS